MEMLENENIVIQLHGTFKHKMILVHSWQWGINLELQAKDYRDLQTILHSLFLKHQINKHYVMGRT